MRRLFFTILFALAVLPGAANAGVLTTAFALLANGATLGGALTATFGAIGAFLIKAGAGLILSLAGQALQGKPKQTVAGITTEQTTTGDVTPAKFVLGRYGLEGHAAAPAYTHGAQNGKLTYIFEVSNIPVTGLTGRVAIDGEWRDIDDDPANEHADFGMPLLGLSLGADPFVPGAGQRAWIKFYDGTQTTADTMLVDKYGDHPDRPWTTDHKLEGTAYAVLTFQYAERLFSGLPAVRFEVDGLPLYDPRQDSSVGGSGTHRWADSSTWEFTRNPQVMVYNILRGITLPTGDIYGLQVPAEDLPLDAWFAAMNECDDTIGSRTKYVAGFEVDVSVEPFEVIRELNKASFTQLAHFGGVYRPRTGPPGTAVLSITDDDILVTEPREMDPFPGLAATHNAVTGTWVDPGSIYQGRSADTILNSEWETEDGDRRLTLDIALPAVTNKSQAQHLLNSYINDDRRFRVHKIALPPMAAILEPLDAIEWDSEHNGYTDKLFEVVEVEDRPDTMVQIVTLRERDAGDVDWSSDDDVPDPAPLEPVSAPDDLVPALTVTPRAVTDAVGGDRRPGIELSWDLADTEDVDLVRWQLRVAATEAAVGSSTVDVEAESVLISEGLVADVAYEARARYVAPGYPTAWSSWKAVTAPDVRLSYGDLEAIIEAEIENAQTDATQALADAADAQSRVTVTEETLAGIVENPNYGFEAGSDGEVVWPIGWQLAAHTEANRDNFRYYADPRPGSDGSLAYGVLNADGGGSPWWYVSKFFEAVPGQKFSAEGWARVNASDPGVTPDSSYIGESDAYFHVLAYDDKGTVLEQLTSWSAGYRHFQDTGTWPGVDWVEFVKSEFTMPAGSVLLEMRVVCADANDTIGNDKETYEDFVGNANIYIDDISVESSNGEVIPRGAEVKLFYGTADEVDGFSAAFAGLAAVTSGGEIAELKLTSWDDPDGSGGSLIQLNAQDVIASGTIYASKLVAVDVTSLVPDSQMKDDESWTLASDFSWNENPQEGFSAVRSIRYSDGNNPGSGFSGAVESSTFPVEQGAEYYAEFKTYNSSDAAEYDLRARIQWYDLDDSIIDNTYFGDLHQGPGGASGLRTHSKNVTAPSGAVSARFLVDTDYENTTTGYNLGDFTARKRQDGATVIKPDSITTELVNTTDFAASGLSVFGGDLQSDDFVAGSAGWKIDKTGDAEFNQLIVRESLVTGAVTDSETTSFPGPHSASSGFNTGLDGGNWVNWEQFQLSGVSEDEILHVAVSCDLKKPVAAASSRMRVFYDIEKDGSWRGNWLQVKTTNTNHVNTVDADSTSYTVTGEWDWAMSGAYDNVRIRIEFLVDKDGEYARDVSVHWQKVKK